MTNTEQTFDPIQFKAAQHKHWNEDAEGYQRWSPTLERWHHDTTVTMLSLANLNPDSQVLDVATGTGEPALSAAKQLGPDGSVLATDISENLVQFARENADRSGVTQIETQVMDGEQLNLPNDAFDVVLCRYGLMYMPSPRRALAEWHRVLKPGGRVVIAVFTAPEQNPWATVPGDIIRQRAGLPPHGFSVGKEDVLVGMLREAGFTTVGTQLLSTPLRMASADEFGTFAREAFGAYNQMMAHLEQSECEVIWDEVTEHMKQFDSSNGFEASCEALVAWAVK